jgi:hypothetical protein
LEHVFDRVIQKSKKVFRPDKSSYDGAHTLKTDQEILDSLPEESFMTTISNSKNAGTI